MTDLLDDLKVAMEGHYGGILTTRGGKPFLRGQVFQDSGRRKCIAAREDDGALEIGYAQSTVEFPDRWTIFVPLRTFDAATPAAVECFSLMARGLGAGCGD